MRYVDDDDRVPAACTGCGSVYVAVKRDDGEIVPIGSESVCTNCGAEEFESLEDLPIGASETGEETDDD